MELEGQLGRQPNQTAYQVAGHVLSLDEVEGPSSVSQTEQGTAIRGERCRVAWGQDDGVLTDLLQ